MRLLATFNWGFAAGEADEHQAGATPDVTPVFARRVRAPPAAHLSHLVAAMLPHTPPRERPRAPPAVAWVNNLPNPLELTEAEKFDYFAGWCARQGVHPAALAPGHRVVLGLRATTRTTANSTNTIAGRGVYDDLFVVLWRERDEHGQMRKRVRQFVGNTEPGAQYVRAMVNKTNENGLVVYDRQKYAGGDSNGDGKNESGRLPDGRYVYERAWHKTFGNILRPRADVLVERDTNHDGLFDAADVRLVADYKARLIRAGHTARQAQAIVDRGRNSLRTMYFHAGGPLVKDSKGVVIAQNTGSAGCQTMPPAVFAKFWETLGAQNSGGQTAFEYVLVTVR